MAPISTSSPSTSPMIHRSAVIMIMTIVTTSMMMMITVI